MPEVQLVEFPDGVGDDFVCNLLVQWTRDPLPFEGKLVEFGAKTRSLGCPHEVREVV